MLEISERTGESMESLYERISKGTLSVEELTQSMRAATSEGGKFFGSMEAQSQTVSGLLSSLKDELQTLGGEIFEPLSEALRTKVLPEAIRIVQEMQDAYSKGGFDGLIDSLTAEIPKLLNAASAALEKLAGKLKAKLPGVIKKLISALPEVLASLGDSILPTLVDTIFEIISVAVEEIVGRLPELVPIILRGVWNLIKGIASGILNVATGLFDGIETALKKLGLLSLTPMEAFEQAWENADTSQIKDIDVQVGVNITAEDYEQQIDSALSQMRETLAGIPGLTDDQRTAIENAIINGSGLQLVEETLNGMDLPEGKAEEIVKKIKEASESIDAALLGLGLTEDQAAYVKQVKASGGSVQEALEAYGIDPTVAKETADSIETATSDIAKVASELGIDPTIIDALEASALSDKDALVAALLLLKVDPKDIEGLTTNYEDLAGSITAKGKTIFQQIYEEYTNGVAETEQDVADAKTAVEGYFKTAYDMVEEWRTNALNEIEKKGLTGDALTTAVANVNSEAQGMIDELNRLEKEAMQWTEDNANKSTEFVTNNLSQLDAIVAQVADIAARIDVLTNEEFNSARSRRSLVQAGAVTNVEHQVEAFALTQAELNQRIQEAETKAGEAFEKAAEDFKNDAEGYAAAEKRILDQLALDKENAYAMYNAETASIIAGIAKSSPDLTAAFEDYAAEQATLGMVGKLQEAIDNAAGTGISLDEFVTSLGEDVDLSAVATALGDAFGETLTTEDLNAMIAEALQSPDGITALGTYVEAYAENVQSDLSTALADSGIDASAIPTIKKAIEEGYLQAAGEMDWTNFETVLSTMLSSTMSNTSAQITAEQGNIETAIGDTVSGAAGEVDASDDGKGIGRNLAKGAANGIAEYAGKVAIAARNMIAAAVAAAKDEAGIHSPSRVTKMLGGYFGEGFALGIEGKVSDAARAAARMAESAIGTIDGIGANMSISSQVNTGGMASAFQNMLAGMNLATDNGQPVQLFINGRLVAETIKRDIAATQAGYNMDLAKGVGKA